MTFTGGCHCGAITLIYETDVPVEKWVPRAGDCSFCCKHAARNISDPAGQLQLTAHPDALTRYRFALRTADFLICRSCGCYVAAVVEDGARNFGTLNLRMLDQRVDQPDTSLNWDHESAEERRARRIARWTPTSFNAGR